MQHVFEYIFYVKRHLFMKLEYVFGAAVGVMDLHIAGPGFKTWLVWYSFYRGSD